MKRVTGFLKKYWITVLIVAAALGYYKYLTDNRLIDAYLFPTTGAIADSFRQYGSTMIVNMFASFKLLIPSVLLGVIIALAVGTVMGLNKRVREVTYPIIHAISVIPAILLSPFALYLAPSFYAASIFLIVYNTIWATLFATINGIMTIDKRYLDNAATLQLKGIRKMFKVVYPAAMPSIMSGFITSLRGSFVVLVYAEMYGSSYGMGYFVRKYSQFGLYQHVWSGFIFMVIVLVIVMQVMERLKNRMLKWTID